MAIGLNEIVFLALLFGCSFVIYKVYNFRLNEKNKFELIKEELKDPEKLIKKLNNPEIELGGEMIKINKVGEQDKNITHFLNEEGNIDVRYEKIKPKNLGAKMQGNAANNSKGDAANIPKVDAQTQ